MVTWVIFLTIGLVIGIAAGMFIGQLDDIKRKQREELQKKLESAEQELVDYKCQVTEHFVKTSTLVNNMTESYKAIHDHLSIGAGTLCDSQLDVSKLNFTEVKVIEKQVTTDNQTVEATSTQAQDDTSVDSLNNTLVGSLDDTEANESAEQMLTEKARGAGFGGVGFEEVAEETEGDTIVADGSRAVANAQESSEDETDSSKAVDSSVRGEEKEEIAAIPNSVSKKDSKQKVEVTVNRIVH